jgi:hypothetical protein
MADTIVAHNMQFKIKGTKYTRDIDNMAVLCNDISEVRKFKTEMQKHKENVIRDIEINNLKNDVAEIKSLLKQLVERG